MKSNTNPEIIIIGAGPGGLTAAIILQHRGFKVKVFERADHVGGRNSELRLGDFHFDLGPTFLMMDYILHEVFAEAGRKPSDYLDIKKIEPMYHLYFKDKVLHALTNLDDMKASIAELFPGEEKGIDLFKQKEKHRFDLLQPCLQKDYNHFRTFLSKEFRRAIPILGIGHSLFGNLGNYFSSELLKLSFTFQSKYLGMSPWECPAAFTMIPYVEHAFGIHHVIGGLNQISQAMAKIYQEDGGELYLNSPVKELLLNGSAVQGIMLDNGEKHYADEVIINSDFAYSMSHLVPEDLLKKYSKKNLKRKQYSCSTFMLYLGLDTKYDLPHHNIFFADDYRNNVEDIFNRKTLSEDTSFYIQNACATDSTLAPEGKSTLYVLVPVANNFSGIQWDREKKRFRDLVIKTLAKRIPEMADIEKHIETEKIITPSDWEDTYNVYTGATFNLAHSLEQMLYFRPHNKFEELDHCYLVGGGTHPGSGLPTIYESAKISANLISKKYGD
ncbi:MAG TPA: phytoene desaturase family protein [Candidatus Cloacimonadota bacterium]|nr:phytoene desaturase family protein [Candidatus Cloacimonadota bacterium]HPT72338.1 phytoene desaturase family protein [Candidatus Cloacimonadota bacterium]